MVSFSSQAATRELSEHGVFKKARTQECCSITQQGTSSFFDLVKYGFWSGEAIPGVRRPVAIRVRTAYSIAAT